MVGSHVERSMTRGANLLNGSFGDSLSKRHLDSFALIQNPCYTFDSIPRFRPTTVATPEPLPVLDVSDLTISSGSA